MTSVIDDAVALYDCRDAFSEALEELMAADERVVAVVNDSLGSTKVGSVAKAFPDRVFNVGIAEQDLVGVGAGLANGGRIPFVCGAASSSRISSIRRRSASGCTSLPNPWLAEWSVTARYLYFFESAAATMSVSSAVPSERVVWQCRSPRMSESSTRSGSFPSSASLSSSDPWRSSGSMYARPSRS